MASTSIFAPQVRSVQPAFVYNNDGTGKVSIYFSLSSYNKIDEIQGLFYTLIDPNIVSTWGSNSMIKGDFKYNYISKNSFQQSDSETQYYFEVTFDSDNFKTLTKNQYYQMQLYFVAVGVTVTETLEWFTEYQEYISEPSQTTLIRPIAQVVLNIESVWDTYNFFNYTATLSNSTEEALESYYCKVYEQLRDDAPPTDSISDFIWESPMYQSDGQTIVIPINNALVSEGKKYAVWVYYTTVHGYSGKISSIVNYISPTNDSTLVCKAVSLNDIGGIEIKSSAGMLQRSVAGTNYWQTIAQSEDTQWTWIDYTVESDVKYQYRIFTTNNTTNSNYANAEISFEDIYMSNPKYLFVNRFNPVISNFRYVVQESIQNTLGGKYPIINRNGSTKYRQFTLTGTIYLQDLVSLSNSFTDSVNRAIPLLQSCACLYTANSSEISLGSSLRVAETKGRQLVMDFLCDSHPKLFRSAEEGNMIVYLSNISFTPNKQLSRHIYDFSVTVNEICEWNMDNLKKYNLNTKQYTAIQINENAEGGI